jgi:hypothetical protein
MVYLSNLSFYSRKTDQITSNWHYPIRVHRFQESDLSDGLQNKLGKTL